MSRVNDVGGQTGFGPWWSEADEPVFHADWEARVYALNTAMVRRGVYSLDEFRDAVERMPPQEYLGGSYYERWLHAIEQLTQRFAGRRGAARALAVTERPPAGVSGRGCGRRLRPGGPGAHRAADPDGHTRVPRYAGGRTGRVVECQGSWPLADDVAAARRRAAVGARLHRGLRRPRPVGRGGHEVTVDLWQSYLEPAAHGGKRTGADEEAAG